MKVVYNGCYGGFGLSPKATHEIAKRKDISLTWKEKGGKISYSPPTENRIFGPSPYHNGKSYYPDYDRTDEILIAVIEEMGVEANGECSSLYIEEIPDGAEYEIDEYDGMEEVVPPRQRW